jgi:hypothetical protein
MASMFDVSTMLSSNVSEANPEIQQLSDRIDTIDERVSNIKASLDNSVGSIDNSIEQIVSVTDTIVAKTQQTLEEQQTQIQLMETEMEERSMQSANKNQIASNYSNEIQALYDKVQELSFDIEKILQQQNTNNTANQIPDIGSAKRLALSAALGGVFGASVLTYLFADESNNVGGSSDQAKDEQTASSETQAAEQGSTPTVQSTDAKSGAEVAALSTKAEDPAQATDAVVQQSNITDTLKMDKIAPLAMDNAKTPGIVMEDQSSVSVPDIGDIAEQARPKMEQYEIKKGESLVKTMSSVEAKEDKRRISLAQNIINVVNEADPPIIEDRKPIPAVIGKITFDDIMRA